MSDILFNETDKKQGVVGIVTLNRARSLNALTLNMINQLSLQLNKWDINPNIKAIIIKSNSDKAFCAGGDIKTLYQQKSPEKSHYYFKQEYQCNHIIHHLETPYLALLDGITMGGGAGISIHGQFRIGSKKLIFAMPETKIGFFPDVGSSYFLTKIPHHFGYYLALSGNSIGVDDSFKLGLITHIIESRNFDEITNKIVATPFTKSQPEMINKILSSYHQQPQNSILLEHTEIISKCFEKKSIDTIIHSLKKNNTNFSKKTIQSLKSGCPDSLKITLKHLQWSTNKPFDLVIKKDLELSRFFVSSSNFYEGIRAALIDKDKMPQWKNETYFN